ncbi:hypothetical protein GPECTOR_79g108 [Gonium pectorale]|uniref:Uncharacterized protein n=1 Tax=Gonium pectorale TaxID=33097 RepID=A0A150G1S2_GONPE|nr:hypothetical protein GPECTOR_79g108 [Gonium pectorale]|eukprot:KXZ43829.1 hypothetical protein GPECTOR_79g108 [Gonium pectorale]
MAGRLAHLLAAPPPLASTAAVAAGAASGAVTVAGVVEEAEELAVEVFNFFQHSVEAMETTVHHLQARVTHALERLENVPLNQLVDVEQLKVAMHPASSTGAAAGEAGEAAVAVVSSPSSAAAHRQLDAALDGVASWKLRDVVDVHKLANALQDVPVSDPLDERLLNREALRIRRFVHWDTVAEAVRAQPLRKALAAMSGRSGNPFTELDIRAAVGAVRVDAVRAVLAPPKPAQPAHSHSLESSGMWTWESE